MGEFEGCRGIFPRASCVGQFICSALRGRDPRPVVVNVVVTGVSRGFPVYQNNLNWAFSWEKGFFFWELWVRQPRELPAAVTAFIPVTGGRG